MTYKLGRILQTQQCAPALPYELTPLLHSIDKNYDHCLFVHVSFPFFLAVDKKQFFEKYGSNLLLCGRIEEVIRREEICDGYSDCRDRTDEENCTQSEQRSIYINLMNNHFFE